MRESFIALTPCHFEELGTGKEAPRHLVPQVRVDVQVNEGFVEVAAVGTLQPLVQLRLEGLVEVAVGVDHQVDGQ